MSTPKARKARAAVECTELMVGKHAFSDVGPRIKTLKLQKSGSFCLLAPLPALNDEHGRGEPAFSSGRQQSSADDVSI